MAKRKSWDDYSEEDMRKRSALNLDGDGFMTKKSPGKRPSISKTAAKGKDESMRKQAMMAALRKRRGKLIPASPTK